jgi:hypothetical protein
LDLGKGAPQLIRGSTTFVMWGPSKSGRSQSSHGPPNPKNLKEPQKSLFLIPYTNGKIVICHHSFIHSFLHAFIHVFTPSSFIHVFMYSFIHSCIHSFIHSCIHSFIHSCIHSFMHSFMYSLLHSFIHVFMYSFIHSCIHSFIHSFIHVFIHSFLHAFMHSFVHVFIHSCIHSFIHSFLYSFIHSFIQFDKLISLLQEQKIYRGKKKKKKPQLFDTCPLIAPTPQAPRVALDMAARLWYSYRSQHEFKFIF